MSQPPARGLRLRFSSSALNYRSLRLLGGTLPRLTRGWMPWLQLARYEPAPLPGPDWARVSPILAGICGTDLALLTGRSTDAMSPFASFPAVLGHEVVGQLTEVGAQVSGFGVGDRVVVDPVISCQVRGLDPCHECRAGHPATCLRTTDGALAPGLIIGYCRDLPGAWSDAMLVHASQLYAVPDAVSDEMAVLIEPLSVALHAVLAGPPARDSQVLVIGGGSLGLLTVAALRLLRSEARVTLLARRRRPAEVGARLGADRVVGDETDAASVTGARPFRALTGRRSYVGGFQVIYDCAGNAASLDLAFRLAAPHGRIVTLGGPSVVDRLDWTPSWVRELRVEGAYVYGAEPSFAGRPHTFEVALRLLAEQPDLPIAELITHRLPLERWRQAMWANLARASSGTLKAVFDLRTTRA